MLVLSDDCLAKILTVQDACRVAAVSKKFKAMVDSNSLWERFLPQDYYQLIARAVSPISFDSKKQIYLLLSESHILLDDQGYMSFQLDKRSGKKCYMLGIRALSITQHNDSRCWNWKHVPKSRFPKVAILRHIYFLQIIGRITTRMLSPKTTYTAYLIFQINTYAWGLDWISETNVSFIERTQKSSRVCLQKDRLQKYWRLNHYGPLPDHYKFPHERADGWMEIELGEFYCDEGDDGEVTMSFSDNQGPKSGLTVEGIELRPK